MSKRARMHNLPHPGEVLQDDARERGNRIAFA